MRLVVTNRAATDDSIKYFLFGQWISINYKHAHEWTIGSVNATNNRDLWLMNIDNSRVDLTFFINNEDLLRDKHRIH